MATKSIIITSGEPAGIGPDICLMLNSASYLQQFDTRLYVIADINMLQQRADLLGCNPPLNRIDTDQDPDKQYRMDAINVIHIPLKSGCEPGILNADNSRYVLDMLDLAIDYCESGRADAMVTAPVQKNIIVEAGFNFTGHTEYLAEHARSDTPVVPVMMLATRQMRVALATTHLPVSKISEAISYDGLITHLKILNDFLVRHAGIEHPHILVAGLNPHAGENGALGHEEIDTIIPAVEALKQQGLNLTGPLPADTLFTPKYLDHADAVFAMYHDQGLPVLKYSGFGRAVNITLGLPFIRTSVDHGTALDLAGKGRSNDSSMKEAIEMAIVLSTRH